MKKICLIIAVLTACLSARAGYLYWQISPSITDYTYVSWSEGSDDSKLLMQWGVNESGELYELGEFVPSESIGAFWANVGDFAAEKYSLNLHNDKFEVIGSAKEYSKSELSAYVKSEAMGQVAAPFTAVPEPTSLGLMLLGLAGLALKRKPMV